MNVSTVGELIETLRKFDPSLPILESDFSGFGYKSIELSIIRIWKVRPVAHADDCEYIDVLYPLDVDNSFYAVVL